MGFSGVKNNFDYNTLRQAVISYLQSSDDSPLASNIDTIVMLAQKRLSKDSKTLLDLSNITQETTAVKSNVIKKPEGWKNTLSICNNDNSKQLILRSYEYCVMYDQNVPSGEPIYYSDFNQDFYYLVPTPDRVYDLNIVSYISPPFLSKGKPTNAFTDNASECLLYACLYESASFLRDDARMTTWFQLYSQAVQALNSEDARRRQDRFINRAAD